MLFPRRLARAGLTALLATVVFLAGCEDDGTPITYAVNYQVAINQMGVGTGELQEIVYDGPSGEVVVSMPPATAWEEMVELTSGDTIHLRVEGLLDNAFILAQIQVLGSNDIPFARTAESREPTSPELVTLEIPVETLP